MVRLVCPKSSNYSRLVVVLEIQCVPAVVIVHERLPLRHGGLEFTHIPSFRGEFAPGSVIEGNAEKT